MEVLHADGCRLIEKSGRQSCDTKPAFFANWITIHQTALDFSTLQDLQDRTGQERNVLIGSQLTKRNDLIGDWVIIDQTPLAFRLRLDVGAVFCKAAQDRIGHEQNDQIGLQLTNQYTPS